MIATGRLLGNGVYKGPRGGPAVTRYVRHARSGYPKFCYLKSAGKVKIMLLSKFCEINPSTRV